MSLKEKLIDAIIEGDNMKVSNVMDRMDVSAVNEMSEKHGMTALHAACGHRNDPALILLLAKSGIDVNAQDRDGDSPLHIAGLEDNDHAVARLLAIPGTDVNVQNKKGFTPLHYACLADNDHAVARLLAIPGIQVNVQNKDGTTPLHYACGEDNDQAVARLLATPGIDVNVKDICGWTPVMYAARLHRVDLPGSSEEDQKCVDMIREERRKREDVSKKKDEESRDKVIEKIENLNIMESPPTGEKAKVDDHQMENTNSPKSQKSEDEIKENPRSSTESIVDDYTGICWSCSKTKLEVKLYKCSGCTRARYCSRECIEHDWPVHKNWCIKQQKKREDKIKR